MRIVHPSTMGGCGGDIVPPTGSGGDDPPDWGVRGQRPRSQKLGCFGQWFWTIVLVHGFVGPCFSADGFGHCNNLYICIMAWNVLYHKIICDRERD